MAKEGKTSVVPKLRFPGFRKAGAWKERELGGEGEFLSSLTGKSAQHFGVGSAKYITYMNVFANTFVDIESLGAVDVGKDESQNAVEVGDVLFTVSSETPEEVGMSSVVLRDIADCYVNSFCAIFRFAEAKRPNLHFLGYLLRQPSVRMYFAKKAQGSTRFNLSKSAFRSLPIAVPPLDEQQKIADCLSALDELIAAQGRKVEALKTYKRGLMQQLFPREGETLPRLRFPEFRDAPEWVVKPLCKVAANLDNKRVPITESERIKGSVPYYGASGVVDYVKDYLFDEEFLCVSEDGANLVARTYPIAFPIAGKTWVNNHAHVLRFKDSATQKIVEDYLNSIDLQGFITGMTQPKLNRAMLDTIPVPLPEADERKKIAEFLFSLDVNLAGASGTLDAFKTHKTGLMQQLFPSLEED